LRDAVAETRTRGAPWQEMTALSALCERKEASTGDRRALRDVLEKIIGGRDTIPVERALALLKGKPGG